MAYRDPRVDRLILAIWLIAVFAVSAVIDLEILGFLFVLSIAILWRGSWAALRKVCVAVVPVTFLLSFASWGWLRLVQGQWPDWRPFVALGLRAALIAFITFSVLARVHLLRALTPFPTLTRLLVITLAQIHSFRLLATESRFGLRSRLLRKPSTADLVRGAGGITGALFNLSLRNSHEISDAMRSRGF